MVRALFPTPPPPTTTSLYLSSSPLILVSNLNQKKLQGSESESCRSPAAKAEPNQEKIRGAKPPVRENVSKKKTSMDGLSVQLQPQTSSHEAHFALRAFYRTYTAFGDTPEKLNPAGELLSIRQNKSTAFGRSVRFF